MGAAAGKVWNVRSKLTGKVWNSSSFREPENATCSPALARCVEAFPSTGFRFSLLLGRLLGRVTGHEHDVLLGTAALLTFF